MQNSDTTSDKDAINKFSNVVVSSEYGLMLQVLPILIDFSISKNKENVLIKLKELIQTFKDSLNEDEKKEYADRVDRLLSSKAECFVEELKKDFDEQEIKEILQMLRGS